MCFDGSSDLGPFPDWRQVWSANTHKKVDSIHLNPAYLAAAAKAAADVEGAVVYSSLNIQTGFDALSAIKIVGGKNETTGAEFLAYLMVMRPQI